MAAGPSPQRASEWRLLHHVTVLMNGSLPHHLTVPEQGGSPYHLTFLLHAITLYYLLMAAALSPHGANEWQLSHHLTVPVIGSCYIIFDILPQGSCGR